MPNYQVEYETWNEYENHVGESYFAFQILPCTNSKQRLSQIKFDNSIDEPIYISKNHHGFDQITFRSLKPFNTLRIHLTCDVHVNKYNPFDFNQLTPEEENGFFNQLDFKVEHHLFLQPSSYINISDSLLDKAWSKKNNEIAFDFLNRINNKIHTEFQYLPNVTDVHNSAKDTFEIKQGVCQDFAHVFITIARLNKIPCRYVAGYLNQGKGFIGNLQMHAWVEAFVPNGGWIGFDPTNNILQDYNYIKVCHGTDYSECGSIKGVIKTLGEHNTKYAVKVIQQ